MVLPVIRSTIDDATRIRAGYRPAEGPEPSWVRDLHACVRRGVEPVHCLLHYAEAEQYRPGSSGAIARTGGATALPGASSHGTTEARIGSRHSSFTSAIQLQVTIVGHGGSLAIVALPAFASSMIA